MKAPFLLLLCLVFINLRLNGSIDWSWWLVMSPMAAHFLLTMLLEEASKKQTAELEKKLADLLALKARLSASK